MRRLIVACLLALVLAPSSQAQDVKPSWAMPDWLKWAPVNGYPMSYREEGAGTPIVLVHGSISDSRAFVEQIGSLSKTYRVIAVHLRHFYPENWKGEGGNFTFEQHAADIAALIKHLNLGKVHLVGHSRGGAVVVEVAKKNPEVIRTLVLPDASIVMPVEETPEAKAAAAAAPDLLGKLKEDLKTGDAAKAAETFVDALNTPGLFAKLPDSGKSMLVENVYTAIGDKSRPMTTCDEVKKFDFPVLLLTGEKSPKRYEMFYGEMRKCNAALPATVVVPNAPHAMQRANPEFFNKAVLDFTAKH